MVSDGGTRPYRVHYRDPSFTNLQAVARDVRGRHGRRRDRGGRVDRPGDGRGGPLMTIVFLALGQRPDEPGPADRRAGSATRPTSTPGWRPTPTTIIARYPQSRSALLPLLHLVQSEDGYLTPAGIAFCASQLGPDRRRGHRGRHVLLDVPAHPDRRVPGRGLHQHAVRDHGRRRDPRRAAGPSGRPRRADHRRRPGHPRTHRVQRRLRLRAGRDGQLGVLRQPDPVVGTRSRRRAARRASRRRPRRGAPLCTFRETARILAGLPTTTADDASPAATWRAAVPTSRHDRSRRACASHRDAR